MDRLVNKTFFKFLLGFVAIVTLSFMVIAGTSYLAGLDAEKNTAQVSMDE